MIDLKKLDITDLKYSYNKNGFVLIKNAINTKIITRCQNEISDLIEKQKNKDLKKNSYNEVFLQYQKFLGLSKVLDELVLNKELAFIACSLSNIESARIFLEQILYKQPGARKTIFHQDAPYLSFSDTRSVNCWISLDNTNSDNGSMIYYPESQKIGLLPIVHLDKDLEVIDEFYDGILLQPIEVQTKPGDIVFHNSLTLHGANANITSKPRRAISIQYMPCDAYFNGWHHDFTKEVNLKIGQTMNQNIFPVAH